jgi:hypothetical protein
MKRARLCVEQLETRFAPASFTWTGAVNANWSNPNNWAGGPAGAVPNAGDTANFLGGTPNCTIDNGAAFAGTVDNLDINGFTGTITLARNVTVADTLSQSSGIIDLGGFNHTLTAQTAQFATGSATIQDGGNFSVTGAMSISENVTFNAVRVTDASLSNSVSWTGGNISLAGAATFTNVGGATFTISCNQEFSATGGTFNNIGQIVKSGAAGTTIVAGSFNNAGTAALVNVLSGTFQILNSVGTDDGEFRTAANTLIQFTAPAVGGLSAIHTLDQGTSFTGSGRVEVDSNAILAVAQGAGVTASCTFELASAGGAGGVGFLQGPGTFTSTNNFIWDGGGVGDDPLSAGMGAVVSIQGGFAIQGLANDAITNSQLSTTGSAIGTWSGNPDIVMAGSTIDNGGSLTVTNDQTIRQTPQTANLFSNSGTFSKTGGVAGTTIDVPFQNSGTLNLNGLTIDFPNYGLTQAGASSQTLLGVGGLLGLGVGPFQTFNVTAGKLSGSGTIGGNLIMSGVFDFGTTAIETVNVAGNYTQTTSGRLTLKLGGTGAGQYDQLNVVGTASLAGTLELDSFNGFVPKAKNKFSKIVHGGNGLAGTFRTITDTTRSGLTWTQTAGANDLDITGN